jgi:hypothetical protein
LKARYPPIELKTPQTDEGNESSGAVRGGRVEPLRLMWRGSGRKQDELSQFAQFLGVGRQEELVLGSALSTSHPIISADP